VFELVTPANVRALFEPLTAPEPSASALLERGIATMEAAGARAASDPRLARGKEFAEEISAHITAWRESRARKDMDAATWHYAKAVEYWQMLRADALFAPAVRSREPFDANVGRKTNVTPEQAAAAFDKFGGNKSKAAEHLGISRPTLDHLLELWVTGL
jgi:DNA-binding NtrC family response regulator